MKKEQYIKEVLQQVHTYRHIKKRLKEDLSQRIEEALDNDPYFDLVAEMGTPKELAMEFMDGLSPEDVAAYRGYNGTPYEFKSKKTLFGLPLIHINTGGRHGASVAKGIIAIGDVAIGGIAIGGLSVGLLSAGGLSLGLFVVGGVALGGVAIGGVALGLYAIGGVAMGILKAFGGVTSIFL